MKDDVAVVSKQVGGPNAEVSAGFPHFLNTESFTAECVIHFEAVLLSLPLSAMLHLTLKMNYLTLRS